MKQKWQPSKWEIYDRITGEVIHTNLDKSDADQRLGIKLTTKNVKR